MASFQSRLSTLGRGLQTLGRGLLDVLYPPRCLGCGARPERPELPLCPRCIQRMERAPQMAVAARLDRLPAGRGIFEHSLSLWMFDKEGTLQSVHHAFKYGDRPRYGVALGGLLGSAYTEVGTIPNGVIPIPLHRTRKLERGYNQSRMLGEGVADVLDCPLRADLLSRPVPTRPQTNLSREDRWKNVHDAFSVTGVCRDGHWLLVDDVLTTGSTVVAAAQALKHAGAERLSLATLALARH